MMLLIGLILIIPVILILIRLSSLKVKKSEKILLNIILLLVSILYIFLCVVINQEPFAFEVKNPSEYMIFIAIIYLFTPFLWIVTIHYVRYIIKKIRVNKNAKIKNDAEYKYYRDDLNKISPNIIMYTSQYCIDFKKSISATILKLKLTGYIKETKSKLEKTAKDTSQLLESEKQVLDLVDKKEFDKRIYEETILKETLDNKYIRKNKGGKIGRIIKIILIILFCVLCFKCSIKLDRFVFDNYRVMVDTRNGQKYYKLELEEDVQKLSLEVKNEEDYFAAKEHKFTNEIIYDHKYIKTDKTQYSIVRKAKLLHILVPVSILFCIVWAIISIYMVIDQLININNNYMRTLKGKNLLTKAYALKNFLKDFSLINKRTKKDISLWEYYLIYSVVLGVNVDIEDEVIQKYLK